MATMHAAMPTCLTKLSDAHQYSLSTATSSSAAAICFQHLKPKQQQQQEPAAPRCQCLAIPHVRQAANWDCGVACALMVLQSLGISQGDLPSLCRRCSTTSVWTVDLAHLLRQCGLKVSFTTTTTGPNMAYAQDAFYMEHLAEDACRVQHLFRAAEVVGIVVKKASLTAQELVRVLRAGTHLVIALCDKRWLATSPAYQLAADPNATEGCRPPLCGGLNAGFIGHYVVLAGYDPASDAFIVQDPACHCPYLRVPAFTFESARRAYGTDEDLLFVSTEGRKLQTA